MILEGESGLGAGPYANLKAATGDPTLEVTLMQYSLGLTLHDIDGPSCLRTFDAIVCDDVLIRAGRTAINTLSIQTLATEDGGDEAWSAIAELPATGISDEIAVSLVTDGANTVRVFYYDAGTSQIEYFENGAKGVGNAGTWGATALCMMVPHVVGLAATTLIRVHYLCAAGGYDNRHFRVAIDNAGWFATRSELYWQLPIDSFDAIVGPQTDDGAAATNDIIVMATDLPHIIGRKVENGELIYTITQVQGIVIIRYQNGRWSDHYEFDVVDEAPSFPSRHDVRLSSSGELLFMTYYREDGSSTYSHTSIAISRSKDGVRWELPYLLTDVLGDANVLLKRGNHAYLLNSWKCYRSPSVGYTGDSQNTQDITDYVVSRIVTSGDVKRLELTLANPEQVLDALGIFSTDMSLQVQLKDGYWSGGSELLVQTMLGDVGVLGGDERLPTDRIMLGARDLLGRMNAIRADQVNEWESQRITGDNFDQASDSVYSGMRHTAVMEGHWKTEGNELYVVPNEAVCVAANTKIRDGYNGSCQTGFKVAHTDTEDYAGLIFRCYDKQNYMNVRYVAEEDQIVLYRVQDNEEIWIAKSTPMGWTCDTWYYLKIRFRYGYVWVYSSTDGTTWMEQILAPIHGVADGTAWTWANFAAYAIPNLTGKMGYVAHGYSDETDEYTPPPPHEPPEPPPEGVFVDAGRKIIGTDAGVFVTDDISPTTPTWYAINDGLDDLSCYDVKRDPFHWWTLGGDDDKYLWVATRTGIWRMIGFPDGAWTQIVSEADIYGFTGWVAGALGYVYKHQMAFSIEVETRFAFICGVPTFVAPWQHQYQAVFVVQGGAIQNATALEDVVFGGGNPGDLGYPGIRFAPHSAGETIWAASLRKSVVNQSRLWRSLNTGGLWTQQDATLPAGVPGFYADVSVPYVDPESSDQYVLWGVGGWVGVATGQYRISEDADQAVPTWANLPGSVGFYTEMRTAMLPDNIWLLGYRPDVERSKWSDDRGLSYTLLPVGPGIRPNCSFPVWDLDTNSLESVTVGTRFGKVYYWSQATGWLDKTGNLAALGVTEVYAIDRDSMGTA